MDKQALAMIKSYFRSMADPLCRFVSVDKVILQGFRIYTFSLALLSSPPIGQHKDIELIPIGQQLQAA